MLAINDGTRARGRKKSDQMIRFGGGLYSWQERSFLSPEWGRVKTDVTKDKFIVLAEKGERMK